MSWPIPKTMHQTPNARNAHDGSRLCEAPKMGIASSRARMVVARPPTSWLVRKMSEIKRFLKRAIHVVAVLRRVAFCRCALLCLRVSH
jgi:hypothetical protein